MSAGGMPGPFRGLVPFDESSVGLFFGRASETASLFQQIAKDGARVTALTGESGAGKTSLLRAGVTPLLVKQGVLPVYLGAYQPLDQQIWQAASRGRADPPTAGETAAQYV